MKKIVCFIFIMSFMSFAYAVPVAAQVLVPSNIWWATHGLEHSDWDKIFFPSYSSGIEKSFIYVPFSTSEIFNANHYAVGTSFVLGPFRAFCLGDVIFDSERFVAETESYSFRSGLNIDSNGDGTPDTWQYTWDNDYSYKKNSWNSGDIYFSPGLALTLGPLTGGARYIFQRFNNSNIDFEYRELETVTDSQYPGNNVATSSDEEVTLTINDSGMVNGLAAGASIDFGFLRLQGDLFATLQTIGRFDASAVSRTHNLAGLGDLDGVTGDFITDETTIAVENGYFNWAGLNAGSNIFTPNPNQRFEYVPADPTGAGLALPGVVHMPQVVTDINLRTEGELFGFIVPFRAGFRGSSLTRDSFTYTGENTGYAASGVQSSHDRTTETYSLDSEGNNKFYTTLGILKRFYGNPLSFQLGAEYTVTTGRYNVRITRNREVLSQVDATGDGDYDDAGDINTTQVQEGWYKTRDYSMVSSTFTFPVNFLFNITKSFEFFGGAEVSYELGREKSAYSDTLTYKTDNTTDNNTGAVTITRQNYDTEPSLQYGVSSINNLTTLFHFGLRYFFTENLILTTELLVAEPTVDTGAGSLFANTLIAEVDFRFGGKGKR